jgi:hypothetical protein
VGWQDAAFLVDPLRGRHQRGSRETERGHKSVELHDQIPKPRNRKKQTTLKGMAI